MSVLNPGQLIVDPGEGYSLKPHCDNVHPLFRPEVLEPHPALHCLQPSPDAWLFPAIEAGRRIQFGIDNRGCPNTTGKRGLVPLPLSWGVLM